MSFSQYSELKTYLATISNRADLTADIPDFIASAEGMIARNVRAVEMVATATVDEADRDAGAVYSLPSDFLGARVLFGTYMGAEYPVDMVSLAELRSYKASVPPYFACTYGFKLEFRGTPETDASYDLVYYQRPAAMSADADTSTLLVNHPDLYIHAGLYWLHVKTQDLELAKSHLELFNGTSNSVNMLASRQRGGSRTAPSHNLGNFNRSAM